MYLYRLTTSQPVKGPVGTAAQNAIPHLKVLMPFIGDKRIPATKRNLLYIMINVLVTCFGRKRSSPRRIAALLVWF